MTGPVSSRPRSRAASPEQARVLLDPEHYALLQLLMLGEVTASGVARALALPLSQAHYRLGRLCALGVAEVAREERRAGRAVKHYRSASEEWFVPFEHTEADTVTDLVGDQIEPRMRVLYADIARIMLGRTDRQGVTLRVRDGFLTVQLAPDEVLAAPPAGVVGFMGQLRLTPEDAERLGKRLRDLVSEFSSLADDARPEYGFGIFLVPRQRPE